MKVDPRHPVHCPPQPKKIAITFQHPDGDQTLHTFTWMPFLRRLLRHLPLPPDFSAENLSNAIASSLNEVRHPIVVHHRDGTYSHAIGSLRLEGDTENHTENHTEPQP